MAALLSGNGGVYIIPNERITDVINQFTPGPNSVIRLDHNANLGLMQRFGDIYQTLTAQDPNWRGFNCLIYNNKDFQDKIIINPRSGDLDYALQSGGTTFYGSIILATACP